MGERMPINIINKHPSARTPSKTLLKALQHISAQLAVENLEINFLFVSDKIIHQWNKKYLNHDYVTDVLAFEMKASGILGDIIVSLDTAKRQAKECGHSEAKEILILCVHGLLHLLGYRDKRKKDFDKMWKKTFELIKKTKFKS